MHYSQNILNNEAAACAREWLVTNGIGGYASGAISGANTRRYHGLLVAALQPPVGRAVLVSHFEESVRDPSLSEPLALSTNLYPDATYPQGYRLLESWTDEPFPGWTWRLPGGTRVQKRIWMAHGYNTTYLSYRLLDRAPGLALCLSPLVAWKNYHAEMHSGPVAAIVDRDGFASSGILTVRMPAVPGITLESVAVTISIYSGSGVALHGARLDDGGYWYYRFQHPREQERGLDYEEDLYCAGVITIPFPSTGVLVRICTGDPPPTPPGEAWRVAASRKAELEKAATSGASAPTALVRAADAFVIEGNEVRSTLIAGYHWFSDWGRDTMISLPGICIATGRADHARSILESFAKVVDGGMLPNRFPDSGQQPEYNTVDATLWYFAAIYHYIQATGDLDLLRSGLWTVLNDIIAAHLKGTRYNIHADSADHLLYAGQPGVQLTWMDARVGSWVVTPRIGKPVEINALWRNALSTMEWCAGMLGEESERERYRMLSEETRQSFVARYVRSDGRGLYDVLDDPGLSQPDASVRPNQIFALSLPFAPVGPHEPAAEAILKVVQEELLTPVGLRTLSNKDPRYHGTYGGDQGARDAAYHQGTVWPWLLGPYAEALYRVTGNSRRALQALQPLLTRMEDYGAGCLPEICNGDAPHAPNGCIAQAWSVGETLRVWTLLASAEKRAKAT
ncbi:MAG TPA: amylo-alpha-1,6-glucosidase [Chthonomonadales bacterium]|nr:amylo-alpha-1,6-glucosidase [Chthonomonadales bacterium]